MRQRTVKAMKTSNTKQGKARVEPTRGARLRYWFDGTMARGTSALVAWLAVVTVVLILVFAVFVTITGLEPGQGNVKGGFLGRVLTTFFHTLDPGTVAGDSGTWRYIVTMLVLTVAGLFIVSALIGVIATGIDDKLAELRRGRSLVIEKDHTVILGWSDSVFAIVRELSIANESRKRPAVVILAEQDKVDMEEQIREKLDDLRGTRVVCRTGSALDLGDLALTNHSLARSIIVLSPGGDEPDSEVIKTLLALTHDGDGPHIVAEIQDPQNLEAARLVGGQRTVIVDKRETIARLIVQTSRQSGAAAVYTELFDFDGDEIYFHSDASLRGSTFAEAVAAYETASVIGLVSPDGYVELNPAMDTVVGDSELVVVAEDDSVLAGASRSSADVDRSRINTAPVAPESTSKVLMLGWNERAATVVRELDEYAQPGSTLEILTELGTPDVPTLTNLTVTTSRGRTSDRATLDRYGITDYDQIIVLCYSDELPVQRADARTLVTLLHLREIVGDRAKGERPSVVSEMLDDRNRALAQVAHVDDVIVSDEILSLILSQLSENDRLEAVFQDLLDADGAEIYLRPVHDYVLDGEPVSYATVVAAAAQRGETALGYRVSAESDDASAGFGVYVNPAKSATFAVQPADRVVVLAES
ncbi:potassium transporter TrkA [Aeromicrobium endophyticum]|uniref:Potassium transporter TrkA n=2 Tax=Aeromicrobium endophyticum TaxID=2292704 RepID=A0A371PAN0_9ACTN|nr:potassium transporter TrkA [Aeromicrobium endophyticum]